MFPRRSDAFWPVAYPLAGLWATAMRLRRALSPPRNAYAARRPVIVVGNLHSGGSGKTPVVAALAEHFAARHPAIVSRGYRGKASAKGARVDLGAADGPAVYGDEPWMLARRWGFPVFIGADRGAALARAEREAEPGLLLLDDAFQNRSFRHHTDLVVIAGDRDPLDADCLPLGDLREGFSALAHATAVVIVAGFGPASTANVARWRAFLTARFPTLPVFEAIPKTQGIWDGDTPVAATGNLSWGAFCGIARPEGFREALAGVVKPAFFEAFADHHVYTDKDWDRLLALKDRHGVHHLVSTEKDWPKAAPGLAARGTALFALRIGYEFSQAFWYFLESRLETP